MSGSLGQRGVGPAGQRGAVLVVIGPITRDLMLRVGELPGPGGSAVASALRAAAGGKGGNPAVAAARLGAQVRLLGAVGDDPAGDEVLEQLSQDRVEVEGVQRLAGQTTGQIVHLVGDRGERRYIESRGANERLSLTGAAVAGACAPGATVLLSAAVPRAVAQAGVEGAHQAGARLVADLAGEPETAQLVLEGAEVVRGDADEITALTGVQVTDFDSAAEAARQLLEQGPRLAIVQAGDHGNLFMKQERQLRQPLPPSEMCDPTGGGDALIAAFTVLYIQGRALEECASVSAAAAAHTVAHLGGRPTFVNEDDLSELVIPAER